MAWREKNEKGMLKKCVKVMLNVGNVGRKKEK